MTEKNKNFVPVLPARDIIVFPHMVAPVFFASEQASIAVENALLTESHEVVILAQKDNTKVEVTSGDIYHSGVLGKIVQIVKFPDGALKALIEGISRVDIVDIEEGEKYIKATYETHDDIIEDSDDLRALQKLVAQQFNEFIQKSTKINIENFISLSDIKEPGKLADIISTYLTVAIEEKQQLVETLNVYERLEKVSKILSKEIELLSIEESLQEKVKFNLGKTQKEYLLREKLKAIKEELEGDTGLDEADELRERVESAEVPDYVKEHLFKELNKLERMSFLTAETSVVRTYVETILELPWNVKTNDILDIKQARRILDQDHFGLEDAKDRILEFLAVKKLSKEPQPTIICFAGPPGVGKTSLARSIARAINRNFSQVSLGGINDESEIRGHRRTYVGAMPGKIIRAIQDAKSKNPVILLDEIEKMIPSHMGDPTAAMLEVLDPAQNSHYTDHYIDLQFDLSDVFFIATANSIDNLYKPLKDRLEIIYLPGYTEEEKSQIAKKFLIPRQFKQNGIEKEDLKIQPSAIKSIIQSYTREAGVRELERNLAKLCRKYALEVAIDENAKICVDSKNIEKYLGVAKFERETTKREPQIGLVHGLAWTEVGGELLEIEASKMPGKGNLNLTGRLGEVMQESAKTAFSYARSNYKKLDLPDDIQERYDMHIHAADGATPKDGPSAGIAITTAIISALTGRPVKGDIAMTGEITLRGRVLPIGGLKEKSIAALRNNITRIIIPKSNKKDLSELPDYIKDNVVFYPVENFNEVINIALCEAYFESDNGNNGAKKSKLALPESLRK